MKTPEIKIQWEEAEIKDVLDYFAKAYKSSEGKIVRYEAFYDPYTGKVAFKLFIQEQP